MQQGNGQFTFTKETDIVAASAFTNEATLLADQIHLNLAAAAKQNRIELTREGSDGFGDEAYRLEVDGHGVTIRAASSAGAFYGCQTLRQLIDSKDRTIPFVTIDDQPRYAWRGLMLDVSRHFFDPPTIRRVLDWMSDCKLNRLHLHLADDQGWRLEIQQYPNLTRIGARGNFSDKNAPPRYFTKAEIREIVRYAAQRHIVVVPEIDMPGHAGAAIRAYPKIGANANTFNPSSDATYDFLKNVLREVMEDFPSLWIHFGGDEVNTAALSINPDKADVLRKDGITDARQLPDYFVGEISSFIAQQGRKPAGWDEVSAAGVSPNTLVYWWRHNKPDVLQRALAAGHSVVLSPRSPCYFDYPQDPSYPNGGWKIYNTPEAVYRGPVIPANLPPAQLKQIVGVEACVWTEHIPTVSHLEFMLIPRLQTFAEMAWTPEALRDFSNFNTRLQPFLEQCRQKEINFYDRKNPSASLRAATQETTNASRLTDFPRDFEPQP